MRQGWIAALAASALLAGPASATTTGAAAFAVPQGEPRATEELRDGEFGVVRRGFGLQRRVEMYQWSSGEEGFRRVWNAAPIDSSGFPANRQNPPEVPLESRRWWSAQATLDGRPIDVEVLKRLGDWEQFRPGFSRLPGNLAATFQPDGDGLSSSINPLDPEIGDLRVTWHELGLPPLAGKVQLREGRWQLPPPGAAGATAATAAAPAAVDALRGSEMAPRPWPWWLSAATIALLALMAVVAVIAIVLRRRRGN